jgi:phosphopantetheinyl transferase
MPLFHSLTIDNDTRLAIWQIAEPQDFFIAQLKLNETDYSVIRTITSDTRLTEFLASRYCVRLLAGIDEELTLVKDEHGKPSVKGHPLHISISHCTGFAGAIISKKAHVGMDIEPIHGRVMRIAGRFLSETELGYLTPTRAIDQATVMWSAKESVYKYYGQKGLSFSRDIKLQKPPDADKGTFEVTAQTPKGVAQHVISFERLGGIMLTYVV